MTSNRTSARHDATTTRDVLDVASLIQLRRARKLSQQQLSRAAGLATRERGLRKVLVEATKHSSVDLETAESFTREVFAVIDRHGADYDGWGGPVES